MRFSKLGVVTAASLIIASSQAWAAPPAGGAAALRPTAYSPAAGKLALPVRKGARLNDQSSLTGSNNGLGIALLAVVVGGAAWAAYEMIKGDDDDEPASP